MKSCIQRLTRRLREGIRSVVFACCPVQHRTLLLRVVFFLRLEDDADVASDSIVIACCFVGEPASAVARHVE